MSSIVGSLFATLGLNTADFDNGAKHAEHTLSKLQETLKEYAGKFAAAFTFEKIIEGIHGSIEAMDGLGKMAQKVGIPVEELSKLSLAAKLADTTLETLAGSTFKLSKNLELIAGGKGGDAGAALKVLGVNATDSHGKLRPTEKIITDIAEKFRNLKDGADKTAIAIALFGKAGAEMIPFLNQGKQGLEEAARLQERFGLTTQASADQAQNFDDNLTTLKAAFDGIFQKVAIELLPQLNNFTDWMVAFVANGSNAQAIAQGITDAFSTMGDMFRQDAEDLRRLQGLLDFVANGSSEFQSMVARRKENTRDMGEAMKFLASQTHVALEAQKKFDAQTSNATAKGDLHMDKAAPGNYVAWQAEQERLKAARDKAARELLAKQKKERDQAAADWRRVLSENMSVLAQTETPIQKYQDHLKKLDWLLSHHIITTAQYAGHLEQLKEQFAATVPVAHEFADAIDNTMKDQFKNWIDSAVDGTFNLTSALDDLLKNLAKLALNDLFSKLLAPGGHPLYGGSSGGGLLGTLFQGLLGFADGGTILPGGSGGIDSQVVAFRKSPNERVDITKPGQMLTNSDGSGDIHIHQNFNGVYGEEAMAKVAGSAAKQAVDTVKRNQLAWNVDGRLRGRA